MQSLNIEIGGMSCGHCVASITKALEAIEGATAAKVVVGSASVSYDPAVTSPAALESAIRNAGFEVTGSSAR